MHGVTTVLPSIALIYHNGNEIVRTEVTNYDDCTQLKVCATGQSRDLAIPLGAILIEMEKVGLCCTNPDRLLFLQYDLLTSQDENG